jgi:hypothetical protein
VVLWLNTELDSNLSRVVSATTDPSHQAVDSCLAHIKPRRCVKTMRLSMAQLIMVLV